MNYPKKFFKNIMDFAQEKLLSPVSKMFLPDRYFSV